MAPFILWERAMLPPQSYLLECFNYNPLTGETLWKVRPRYHFTTESGWKRTNKERAGKPVSQYDEGNGYRMIGITYDGKVGKYSLHSIIWKIMTGVDHVGEIDHKDTVRSNNQWLNLRQTTVSQNRQNSKMKGHNTHGFKGVSKMRNKFQAAIMVNNIRQHLGTYSTPEEAHAVYCEASVRLHGEFGRTE